MFLYFCALRLHSSMDRIPDSGSGDMGSNPIEVTTISSRANIYVGLFNFEHGCTNRLYAKRVGKRIQVS